MVGTNLFTPELPVTMKGRQQVQRYAATRRWSVERPRKPDGTTESLRLEGISQSEPRHSPL